MPRKRKRELATRIGSSAEASPAHLSFSTHRAFVVQFQSSEAQSGGRAEHITSGEAVLFEDKDELFKFFIRVLRSTDRVRSDKG